MTERSESERAELVALDPLEMLLDAARYAEGNGGKYSNPAWAKAARAAVAKARLVAQDHGGADAGAGVQDGYIKNCHVWPRNGETLFTDPGGTTRVTLDGYAVIPIEEWNALSKPAVAANASAEARLREQQSLVERIIIRRLHQEKLDGYTIETAREIIEALSAHPHASDCDKQRENEAEQNE